MKNLVLDSYALIAYLENERGADRVEELFEEAKQKSFQILMSMINWGEVYYSIFRTKGEEKAEEALLIIQQLPIKIINIQKEIVYQASRFKGKYRIAFGDCFAAALAVRENCKVITGDKEFKKLESEVEIEWL